MPGNGTPVEVGQVWSALLHWRVVRCEFRIDVVDGGKAHGTDLATGKPLARPVSVRTLSNGYRGSRLVRYADGTPVDRPSGRLLSGMSRLDPAIPQSEPRIRLPRGVKPLDHRDLVVKALRDLGAMSAPAMARQLGVHTSVVLRCLQRIECWEEFVAHGDPKLVAAVSGSGTDD